MGYTSSINTSEFSISGNEISVNANTSSTERTGTLTLTQTREYSPTNTNESGPLSIFINLVQGYREVRIRIFDSDGGDVIDSDVEVTYTWSKNETGNLFTKTINIQVYDGDILLPFEDISIFSIGDYSPSYLGEYFNYSEPGWTTDPTTYSIEVYPIKPVTGVLTSMPEISKAIEVSPDGTVGAFGVIIFNLAID